MRTVKRSFLTIALGAVSWHAGHAQAQDDQAASQSKFEVASVHRGSAEGRRLMSVTPSGLSYMNVTLTDSFVAVYGIERYRAIGPDWLSRQRYVIEAKTAAPVEPPEVMQMLQSLLAERFKLSTHWERQELPICFFQVAKDGPTGFRPVSTRLGVVPIPGGMMFQGITMPEFVSEFLAGLPSMDRAVVDGTGLNGRYEFSLRVFPADVPSDDLKAAVIAGGPDLFVDALEQVGLRLTRQKRAVEVLIVDHADRSQRRTKQIITPTQEAIRVVRAQCDDQAALESLLRSVQPTLQRYVRRLAGHEFADDIVQDTMITVARKLKWLSEPRLFRAWAFRIASRQALRCLHKERHRNWHDNERLLESLPNVEAPPPEQSLPDILSSDVLSPASRAVMVLHFKEGLTLPEIASILEIPLGTAKSRLAYGLHVLRRHFGVEKESLND